MEIKSNIEWRDYQADTIKSILNNDNGIIHVVKSPRQNGKTTMAESILLYYAINYENSFSLFLSPTIKQARKVFLELKKAIEKSSIFSKANESTLEMTFYNSSKIIFCSAEQGVASLQGYTVNKGVLIIDEAAFIPDDIFYALFPICDAHNAPILLTSTPRLKAGLFYEYFQSGLLSNSNIISYDWAGHTLLTPEKLKFYKSKMPLNTYRNYYLGEFTDFGNGSFGDFSEVLQSEKFNPDIVEPDFNHHYYTVGIDWGSGTGNDYTAISIMNNEYKQVYIEQFNDKNTTETISRVMAILKRFKPTRVLVETNSIGRIFYNLLCDKYTEGELGDDITLDGFNTSNESKNQLVSDLQIKIQNKEISLVNDDVFKDELNNYESALSPSGKVTYNAKNGHHDDLIIATMLSMKALGQGSYDVL